MARRRAGTGKRTNRGVWELWRKHKSCFGGSKEKAGYRRKRVGSRRQPGNRVTENREPRMKKRVSFSVLGSRFSVLGSRFSVLGSRFSVLGSRFSVLGSRFSVLGSRFSVLGSRFSVLGSRLHGYPVSSLLFLL